LHPERIASISPPPERSPKWIKETSLNLHVINEKANENDDVPSSSEIKKRD